MSRFLATTLAFLVSTGVLALAGCGKPAATKVAPSAPPEAKAPAVAAPRPLSPEKAPEAGPTRLGGTTAPAAPPPRLATPDEVARVPDRTRMTSLDSGKPVPKTRTPRSAGSSCAGGANVLVTLTNDAWYAESAGPRQHLVHAAFRAAENRRPLLRSGNNSDTCLIMPSGEIVGLLSDPVTGSRFTRGSRTYEVPVWDDLGNTFYSRHGDVFAGGCALASLVLVACLCGRRLGGRRQL